MLLADERASIGNVIQDTDLCQDQLSVAKAPQETGGRQFQVPSVALALDELEGFTVYCKLVLGSLLTCILHCILPCLPGLYSHATATCVPALHTV